MRAFRKDTQSDMDELKNFSLESRLQTGARSRLAGLLLLSRTRIIRATDESRESADFTDALFEALSSGTISRSELERVLRTDMIIKATRHSAIDQQIYIVVEASYTCDAEELDKVLKSAEVLRRVFPETEILTTLYFAQISEQGLGAAEAAGVIAIVED